MISLKKDQFEPNEEIFINFNIDNSKCGRDVKSFKAKLNREIVVFKEKGKKAPIFSKNEYLIEQKQPVDVKAKSKSEKSIIFKLPAEEKAEKTGPLDAMHPTLQLLTKTFSVSQSRGIFMIKYKLDLFIKHKSMTEFGQGNFVSFPIIVRSVAHNIRVLKDYQDQLIEAFASDFKPHTTAQKVSCGIFLNEDTGEIETVTTNTHSGGQTTEVVKQKPQLLSEDESYLEQQKAQEDRIRMEEEQERLEEEERIR